MTLPGEVLKANSETELKKSPIYFRLQFKKIISWKTFRYRPKALLSVGKTCLRVSPIYVRFELIEAPEKEQDGESFPTPLEIKNVNLINRIKARIMFSLNLRCEFSSFA